MKLSSRERLDLNLSTTFAELAVTAMQMWSTEGNRVLEKPRGSYAPYKIENHTGLSISLSSSSSTDRGTLIIAEDQATDWRFDDWKAMREVISFQVRITGLEYGLACIRCRAKHHRRPICWEALGRSSKHTGGQGRRICILPSTSHGQV